MSGYELSRQYFDWAMENPDKNTPSHAGLMFWLIELNNRLGWKDKFGLPTVHTMEVLGISSYKTFKKIFDDLIEWGFIRVHQRAKNNYTSNIIELVKFTEANTKALTNSLQTHIPAHDSLTYQLSVDIDKPQTEETIKPIGGMGKPKPIKFIPPSIDEIIGYCDERGNKVDAIKFLSFYESNGWRVGKNPMKNWKAAIHTWERSEYSSAKNFKSENRKFPYEQQERQKPEYAKPD